MNIRQIPGFNGHLFQETTVDIVNKLFDVMSIFVQGYQPHLLQGGRNLVIVSFQDPLKKLEDAFFHLIG